MAKHFIVLIPELRKRDIEKVIWANWHVRAAKTSNYLDKIAIVFEN